MSRIRDDVLKRCELDDLIYELLYGRKMIQFNNTVYDSCFIYYIERAKNLAACGNHWQVDLMQEGDRKFNLSSAVSVPGHVLIRVNVSLITSTSQSNLFYDVISRSTILSTSTGGSKKLSSRDAAHMHEAVHRNGVIFVYVYFICI